MTVRIIFFIILLASILFLPFWVSFLLAIIGMVFFLYYFEAIFILFISDLLYGATEARYFNLTFVSLVLSVILFLAIQFLKKRSTFQSIQ
ncbi:hypothetical protein A2933_00385 [Candidatus Nomurabacteria bacterium RIFCSPLOWO2_01_FULL_46_18]|uniref:Uncharacterized protein n=1 Tax=Candidatus Nomurabacteria bacterium RIFCSPLOWO2_01_FULL_46_18 TaxID=1801783 RepID=A0A1F6XE90_9BACT|nr:MAG: hypothetical protein A2933_00385 [Candidatus Nomurabacteria bacterium RIFCSPLOWO2_01_FULL_46_18]